MMNDAVLTRLAAANPVGVVSPPTPTIDRRGKQRRRALVLALAAAAIAAPAVAFADDIGALFGFTTEGQPVATSATPFAQVSALNDALQELAVPPTLRLLAQRGGIGFYAARRPDGVVCFAVDSERGKAVGCDFGSPTGARFPSAQRPIIDFSRIGGRLAGFAADGVASVALVDAAAATIATAPVIDNVYANADVAPGGVGVQALDAQGTVVYRHAFGEAP
jgi:hypothetical protein